MLYVEEPVLFIVIIMMLIGSIYLVISLLSCYCLRPSLLFDVTIRDVYSSVVTKECYKNLSISPGNVSLP